MITVKIKINSKNDNKKMMIMILIMLLIIIMMTNNDNGKNDNDNRMKLLLLICVKAVVNEVLVTDKDEENNDIFHAVVKINKYIIYTYITNSRIVDLLLKIIA